MPAFLFDNNISWAIAEVLSRVEYSVRHVRDVFELGTRPDDEDIISWCSKNDAVWVTADYKSRRMSKYGPLIKQTGISVAWFRYSSKNPWDAKKWLRIIVNKIDTMERDFSERRSLCIAYAERGKRELV